MIGYGIAKKRLPCTLSWCKFCEKRPHQTGAMDAASGNHQKGMCSGLFHTTGDLKFSGLLDFILTFLNKQSKCSCCWSAAPPFSR